MIMMIGVAQGRIDLSISSLLYHIISSLEKFHFFHHLWGEGVGELPYIFFPPEHTAGSALINYYVL